MPFVDQDFECTSPVVVARRRNYPNRLLFPKPSAIPHKAIDGDLGTGSQSSPSSRTSKPEKRGRKSKLTPEEKDSKKIQRDKEYRQKKAADNKALQEKCQLTARTDQLKKEMIDEFKKVNMVERANKALESGMQQLQEDVLNQDDQRRILGKYKCRIVNCFATKRMKLKESRCHTHRLGRHPGIQDGLDPMKAE
ncbi:hypothetical protein DITRI_Ditri12bG0092400 [Diplodiscus trichospermus]